MILYLMALCSLPFTLLGTFIFIKLIVMPNKAPADVSNRINHLRLVWFAIQSPELFVDLFPWLKRDEYENVSR